jgi:magnesium and cobalt transporter
MIALISAWLPELSGLVMVWAALIALAGEGGGDLRSSVLVRSTETGLPPERTLHVMHLATLTLAAALAGTATAWWVFPPVTGMVRVALVTLLVWSLGDLVPRLLAVLAPELVPHARRIALAAAPVYTPLLWMARRLEAPVVERAPGTAERAATSHEMVRGVFSLKAMTVSEVMTPRLDIVAVDVNAEEHEVLHILRHSEHARLLVDDGNADAVVGIIYAKDVLPRVAATARPAEPWQTLIRPASFVPEAKTLDRQLRDFQRGPGHIAVVVDEYGGTSGLVTLEDILEQIVGEIQDEYDVDEVAPVARHHDGHLTVQGGVPLADLEQELGHQFEREDVDTVGGLVLAQLGRVPRAGDTFTLDGWRFVTELVIRRRVRRVSVYPAAALEVASAAEVEE